MKKEKITLRKFEERDIATRCMWINSPLVYKTMNFDIPISLESTKKWYERNHNDESRFDCIFELSDITVVAMGGLTNIDKKSKKAEFYLFVSPDFQKKGIGSQATHLLCRYGFENIGLEKIYLFANSNNLGAKHTYEKVGFMLEGIHRRELYKDGVWLDRLYYGIFQNELKKQSKLIL